MKKVLLVDNDRILLRMMAAFLEKRDYHVETAIDGLNALDILKTFSPEVIFIDLVMPNIDGEKLCRILRSQEEHKETFLVILSAISAEEQVDVAALGANACIAKGPFNEMAQHILEVIENPEYFSAECLSGRVYGSESVYPRGITEELLSVKKHSEIILEKMLEGVLEINADARIVYANTAVLSLTGKPFKELLGAHLVDLFSGEDRRRVSDLLQKRGLRSVSDSSPVRLHQSLVSMDIIPLDEAETSAIIILHDETERRQAENDLRSAREYAQNIIDSSLDMIITVGVDRKIVAFNRAAEAAFGYRREEIVGKPVSLLYADAEEEQRMMTTARENDSFIGEITNVDKNGNTFPSLVSVAFMKDKEGKVIGAVGVSRDITEQRRSQQEMKQRHDELERLVQQRAMKLRETEERYQLLFQKAADSIFLLTVGGERRGTIVEANQAAAEMHGYTVDELIGMSIRSLDAPQEADEFADRYAHLKEGEWIQFEIDHLRKDGTVFPVEVSAGLIELEGKQFIMTFDRDITERKRASEEREKLMSKLRRSEKMEAIGTLAGGVAHDLNKILSGIVSYPELILLDLAEDSPLKEPIRTIQRSGRKAAAIVQDLLALARRGVVTETVVDLREIVNEYLESAEYAGLVSDHPDIHVAVDLQPNTLSIRGSTVHLSKALMNLVTNAFEAITKKGRVVISVYNRHVSQAIDGFDTIGVGEYVVLQVTDDGVGIAPEHAEKIFEPFYSKKRMGRSGTGLGMAVIWGTVKDHKGYIDLQSTVGEGTVISLFFPVTRSGGVKEKPSTTLDMYMGHNESILVVDDVAEQREILADMLTRLRYKVKTAASGEEAIDYLMDHRVDLLILDMIMDPGIDGLETYKRATAIQPRQKAIIASGFSETERVRTAQNLGAGAYIRKPYTMEKIGMAVMEELSK